MVAPSKNNRITYEHTKVLDELTKSRNAFVGHIDALNKDINLHDPKNARGISPEKLKEFEATRQKLLSDINSNQTTLLRLSGTNPSAQALSTIQSLQTDFGEMEKALVNVSNIIKYYNHQNNPSKSTPQQPTTAPRKDPHAYIRKKLKMVPAFALLSPADRDKAIKFMKTELNRIQNIEKACAKSPESIGIQENKRRRTS